LCARDTLFNGSIDCAPAIPICGGEANDGTVGYGISRTVANRFGLHENSSLRSLAFNSQIARIGSNLLHSAPRRQIAKRSVHL
jgi:hypothetical protein